VRLFSARLAARVCVCSIADRPQVSLIQHGKVGVDEHIIWGSEHGHRWRFTRMVGNSVGGGGETISRMLFPSLMGEVAKLEYRLHRARTRWYSVSIIPHAHNPTQNVAR
jgi:hypothetical protein